MLEIIDVREFDRIYDIMELSFPHDEVRSRAGQRALTEREVYRIYATRQDGRIVGFLAVYDFSDFAFIEHFAIDPELRGGGLGSAMLAELCEAIGKSICLEAELPETELARRRIGFYERNGFFANPYPYIQPPIEAGRAPVPLCVMSYGRALGREEFERMREVIYREVYRVY